MPRLGEQVDVEVAVPVVVPDRGALAHVALHDVAPVRARDRRPVRSHEVEADIGGDIDTSDPAARPAVVAAPALLGRRRGWGDGRHHAHEDHRGERE